jgi:DNA-binding LacI/PurR family transcriptional regulator
MGQAAAAALLGLIHNGMGNPHRSVTTIHPKLVVRDSTGNAVV